MIIAEEILNYWFGDSDDELHILKQYSKLWFGKDEQVDREIKRRFIRAVETVGKQGLLAGAEPVARRYLATILLLDQFTRNIYRNQPRGFAGDPLALDLTLDALEAGYDQRLRPIERVFLYLPLEHSENLGHQDRCVELFTQLHRTVAEPLTAAYAGFLDYAVRHQQIIARFGRFPHRNQILGRPSSTEERHFLLQPNSSF